MSRAPFIVMILLGAGAILALAFQAWDRPPGAVERSAARAVGDTASRQHDGETAESEAAATLEAVVKTNTRILAQLEQLDSRLSNLETERTQQEDLRAEQEREREMLKKAKSNPKLIARYNEIRQQSREQRSEKLGEQFNAEPVDYAWAEETESSLKQTIDDRVGERAILEDVKCRSSMCKMVLALPSAADGNIDPMELAALEIDLVSGLSSSGGGAIQAHHRLEDDGLGGLRYVSYVARPGRRLPPPEDPFEGMDIEEAIDFLETEP